MPCVGFRLGNRFGGSAGGRQVGAAVVLAKMGFAISPTALLNKFVELR